MCENRGFNVDDLIEQLHRKGIFEDQSEESLAAKRLAIFAILGTEPKRHAVDPGANEDDIAHLLGEVLLSFRLMFGQSPASRRLFRSVFEPGDGACSRPDTLLQYLCSEKRLGSAATGFRPTGRQRQWVDP
ncbi:hypothetical protein SODALDRAFT_319546 [Sodiomyces alkalinus F11]|uniref:Uncharacterized protein n=1 Tax=Sodiomyces alkalinus (strain CBS 110278 / VKM F-3762 / F11) TaxID=1314773 RepID=A0A3N2Q8H3_SODAK|nr:hypothetical protein SODALDRAFT_319546 [Sodiomyces alkalinus F11]ROT42987.1 hypothetical protein SODALDRAFT_319546 [Sodiomyces alkalinus F11]